MELTARARIEAIANRGIGPADDAERAFLEALGRLPGLSAYERTTIAQALNPTGWNGDDWGAAGKAEARARFSSGWDRATAGALDRHARLSQQLPH